MQKRRTYSEEFKREAVNLVSQPGITQKQIGEELGLNATMIGRWRRELVIQAVLMALWQRQGAAPVIVHSDRGCQFTSTDYQRFLKGHNLICSMSAVDSCADNASMEGFFGLLKRERVKR